MAERDARKGVESLESNDSETEIEQLLDEKDYQESIKWKFGQLKDAPAAKKKKTMADIIKRCFVGFFVLGLYVNSYLISTLTMALLPYYLLITAQHEMLLLKRNETKDRQSWCYTIEWAIALAGHFMLLPKSLMD